MKKSKFNKRSVITSVLLGIFAVSEAQAKTQAQINYENKIAAQQTSIQTLVQDGISITRFDPRANITTGLRPLIASTTDHVSQYLSAYGSNPALQTAWTDAVSATLPLLNNNAARPTEGQVNPVITLWDTIHTRNTNPSPLVSLAQAME